MLLASLWVGLILRLFGDGIHSFSLDDIKDKYSLIWQYLLSVAMWYTKGFCSHKANDTEQN